jgi:hypothetical protein
MPPPTIPPTPMATTGQKPSDFLGVVNGFVFTVFGYVSGAGFEGGLVKRRQPAGFASAPGADRF